VDWRKTPIAPYELDRRNANRTMLGMMFGDTSIRLEEIEEWRATLVG
jgi:hypothetical protein